MPRSSGTPCPASKTITLFDTGRLTVSIVCVLGKDPFTIIGGEPLSVAENKAASSSKEKVVAGFSDSKPAPASSN